MYTQIKIEKEIPLPRSAKSINGKYPFAQLCVGDSFFVNKIKRNSLKGSAYYWRKLNGKKWRFATAAEANGARIWRVE